MAESKLMLSCCLYFTAGNLARAMNDMANACFQPTGLNPSQGFALLCVIDEPGVQPSVIADRLGLAPSTITRVIDALRNKGLVEAESGGRTSLISPTNAGIEMSERVRAAWLALYEQYGERMGQQDADDLCALIHQSNLKLNQPAERTPS